VNRSLPLGGQKKRGDRNFEGGGLREGKEGWNKGKVSQDKKAEENVGFHTKGEDCAPRVADRGGRKVNVSSVRGGCKGGASIVAMGGHSMQPEKKSAGAAR